MSALPITPDLLIQCEASGLYLSDISVHTLTVTVNAARAMRMQPSGADRFCALLSSMYPSFGWRAIPAEG